jgi:hypothetical protein
LHTKKRRGCWWGSPKPMNSNPLSNLLSLRLDCYLIAVLGRQQNVHSDEAFPDENWKSRFWSHSGSQILMALVHRPVGHRNSQATSLGTSTITAHPACCNRPLHYRIHRNNQKGLQCHSTGRRNSWPQG